MVDDTRAVPIEGTTLDAAQNATRRPGWVAPASGEELDITGLSLLAPIEVPGSFRDFYAFERHVATARARRGLDMDPTWYRIPVFYFSNPAVLSGPDAVVQGPASSQQLDYELELGWVVGDDLVPVGFTVLNDWSARDLQREEMTLSLGPAKGKDFATSVGPVLVTADEFDPSTGAMRAWVNGRLYSEADLSERYWSIADMTAYAARDSIVSAGDLFGTGTCGTGCILELSATHGEDAYPWLRPGDVVELEIEGIGLLRNNVG